MYTPSKIYVAWWWRSYRWYWPQYFSWWVHKIIISHHHLLTMGVFRGPYSRVMNKWIICMHVIPWNLPFFYQNRQICFLLQMILTDIRHVYCKIRVLICNINTPLTLKTTRAVTCTALLLPVCGLNFDLTLAQHFLSR